MAKVKAIVTLNFFILQGINGSSCTQGPVLLVFVPWIVEANESEITDFILLKHQGLDVTVWLEKISHLLLLPSNWYVLHINIVDEFANLPPVLWLEY